MKILVINGPNLNLLGSREPSIYGSKSLSQILDELVESFPLHNIQDFQSNVEGELIDTIQAFDGKIDGIVLNAGGYSHTSVAIRDAIADSKIPMVEVHMSNVAVREEFRHQSMLAAVCIGTIAGFGSYSYDLGVLAIENYLKEGP